jgi:hypothetical protein
MTETGDSESFEAIYQAPSETLSQDSDILYNDRELYGFMYLNTLFLFGYAGTTNTSEK